MLGPVGVHRTWIIACVAMFLVHMLPALSFQSREEPEMLGVKVKSLCLLLPARAVPAYPEAWAPQEHASTSPC